MASWTSRASETLGASGLESEADTKILLARQAFEEGDLEFAEALVKEARAR